MGGVLEVLATGSVWDNADPDARSLHAWHPTLARLGDGRWLCSFDLASAILAPDYGTWLAASEDDGRTWSEPWPMAGSWDAQGAAGAHGAASTQGQQASRATQRDPGPTTHTLRIARLPDGSLVASGARWRRHGRYARGLNRENAGWCPMDLVISHSPDGRAWDAPAVVVPPLRGPAFEICHRIVPLADGRWLWPTSTWRGWDGDEADGMRAVALVSTDRGRAWPEHIEVFDGRAEGIVHWEQSMAPLEDGHLLVVSWAFDPQASRTHPLPWAVSRDGRTFDQRGSTGILAQTTKLAYLGDRRVLAVYRRDDEPGLWGALAQVDADGWRTLGTAILWDGAGPGMRGDRGTADDLSQLAFGSPSVVVAADGDVLVAFWRRVGCQYGIGWIRLRIRG